MPVSLLLSRVCPVCVPCGPRLFPRAWGSQLARYGGYGRFGGFRRFKACCVCLRCCALQSPSAS
eukprot:945631-Prymnesium_polylepis.1